MTHEIIIYNKTRRRVSEKFIKAVISKMLNFLKIKQPIEVAVLNVESEEIKRLNKIWRHKNDVPDELSFGLNSRKIKALAKSDNDVLNLGHIVVNSEKIYNKNLLKNILIHSMLHLLGYSHRELKRLEKNILINL